jgi:hypothetical protein
LVAVLEAKLAAVVEPVQMVVAVVANQTFQ